jgi:hypothetical protein
MTFIVELIQSVYASYQRLRILSLGGNNIGDDGAVALARGLADNDTLTELLVFSNSISLKHGPSHFLVGDCPIVFSWSVNQTD